MSDASDARVATPKQAAGIAAPPATLPPATVYVALASLVLLLFLLELTIGVAPIFENDERDGLTSVPVYG